jgi:hypothetical protein
MKLYELAKVCLPSVPIYVFTTDRDGKVNGEFESHAKDLRDKSNDWEICDVEPDGYYIIVNVLSRNA